MNHRVVDNFLTHHELAHLQEVYLEDDFPWFWGPTTVPYEGSNCENELDNYQFCNTVYYPPQIIQSNYLTTLSPIWQALEMRSLLRLKLNMNPRTTEIVEHGHHVDFPWEDSYSGVFYFNTNDGYTKFEDGTKVESIANRMVIFPANIKHTGTTCTDQQSRIVLNINWF